MKEFVINCWQYIVVHKDQIILFFTSGTFVSIVATVFALIRSIKQTKLNSTTNMALSSSLDGNTKALNKLADIEEEVKELLVEVKNVKTEVTFGTSEDKAQYLVLINNLESLANKCNVLLEVQSISAQNIRNTDTRDTIVNLLTNAKYSETITRDNLKNGLDDIVEDTKSQIAKTLEALNAKVDGLKAIVGDTESAKVVKAAEKETNIRY